jgi:hypothetical protein
MGSFELYSFPFRYPTLLNRHTQYTSKLLSESDTHGRTSILSSSNPPQGPTIGESYNDSIAQNGIQRVRTRGSSGAIPGGPMYTGASCHSEVTDRTESCHLCQSSTFESEARKAATYTPSELHEHKKQHHSDNSTFDTWLLYHHNHPDCYACPICPKSLVISPECHNLTDDQAPHGVPTACELQLHLLERHKDDVPSKLPESIYSLAFRGCMESKDFYIKGRAWKYQYVANEHAAAAMEREKERSTGIRGESSKGGEEEGKA